MSSSEEDDSEQLVVMRLSRVLVSEINDQQAIYLREMDGPRTFPILIGPYEAEVINRRLLEEPPFRPMTHELLLNVIRSLDADPVSVIISDIRDHTYYAVLKVRRGDELIDIDCRPSDAIALSVHVVPHLPIYAAEKVLSEAAR